LTIGLTTCIKNAFIGIGMPIGIAKINLSFCYILLSL
jgi:hypothetical protein